MFIYRMKSQIDEHNNFSNKDLFKMTFEEKEIDEYVNSIVILIKDVYKVSVVRKNKVDVKLNLLKENFNYNKLTEDSPGK